MKSMHTILEESGSEIDFETLYARMSKEGIQQMEKKSLTGKEHLPVRLIITLVSPEVYSERIRRLEKEAKKKGRSISKRTRMLYHFNLMITSVEAEKLSVEKIYPLCRSRRQVELMFKNRKSVFSLAGLQKMKENRYITMLYVRLILVVVNLQIIYNIQFCLSKTEEKNLC
ncbi:MAG: transposase [Bacteroidales bacterium]|nr:transposase [Bacteroidales bacterium]